MLRICQGCHQNAGIYRTPHQSAAPPVSPQGEAFDVQNQSPSHRKKDLKEQKMNQFQNKKLTPNAKTLRKTMTKEERHLWYDFLKALPMTVHRQKVIGSYIVDFYIAQEHLVIELDGSQHYETLGKQVDETRDSFLKNLGITVLRYSNLDVNRNFAAVCEDILHHMNRE